MNNSILNQLSDTLDSSVFQQNSNGNVDKSERIVSVGAGAFFALKGLSNVFSHPFLAIAELGIGGALLYRGITGYCAVKERLENENTNSVSTTDAVPQSALPTEAY